MFDNALPHTSTHCEHLAQKTRGDYCGLFYVLQARDKNGPVGNGHTDRKHLRHNEYNDNFHSQSRPAGEERSRCVTTSSLSNAPKTRRSPHRGGVARETIQKKATLALKTTQHDVLNGVSPHLRSAGAVSSFCLRWHSAVDVAKRLYMVVTLFTWFHNYIRIFQGPTVPGSPSPLNTCYTCFRPKSAWPVVINLT